jgi:hypothetical protein
LNLQNLIFVGDSGFEGCFKIKELNLPKLISIERGGF